MKVHINGVNIKFTKNERDGLYYAKLKRINTNSINYCNEVSISHEDTENEDGNWNLIVSKERKKWPTLTREIAHSRWGHPHYDQMNKMSNFYKINLTGKLPTCSGCAVVKSRAMQTTRTCKKEAETNGECLFIDTTEPYPKSRGGKKYWLCGVDNKYDKTWVQFAPSKKHMVNFVKELVTTINGLDLKVKYIWCNNASEHQQELMDYCKEVGIVLDYTAPNTPK